MSGCGNTGKITSQEIINNAKTLGPIGGGIGDLVGNVIFFFDIKQHYPELFGDSDPIIEFVRIYQLDSLICNVKFI